MCNKLILAGAGTGKTTYIVDKAIKETKRILITTYTIKCREEIKEKIKQKVGFIPNNIIIQTWFSFLLEHGIMPYKSDLRIEKVNGICFVEGKSGINYINKNGKPIYYGETDFFKYYFDNYYRIYTDKISKLVLKIDESNGGLVFNRIEKIFDKIYIDEVQDLSGYDLDIIKAISKKDNYLTIVGDPRQNVYNTHFEVKYKKYNDGKIDEFIRNECKNNHFNIDVMSLNTCYRCHEEIVKFLNDFYKEYQALNSILLPHKKHQGIYVVRTKDLNEYLRIYNPIQLRYNKLTKINEEYKAINYRNSKGCTYDRTIVYPTNELKNYLKNGSDISKIATKNSIYVALSRAINSVGIVYDGEICNKLNIKIWNGTQSEYT